MSLGLLREREGEFRRHAGGVDGTDMRECSAIDFTRYLFSLVITEVHWETRACRKHKDRCGDPRGIRTWFFFVNSVV